MNFININITYIKTRIYKYISRDHFNKQSISQYFSIYDFSVVYVVVILKLIND